LNSCLVNEMEVLVIQQQLPERSGCCWRKKATRVNKWTVSSEFPTNRMFCCQSNESNSSNVEQNNRTEGNLHSKNFKTNNKKLNVKTTMLMVYVWSEPWQCTQELVILYYLKVGLWNVM
jgi:hypothetical protein